MVKKRSIHGGEDSHLCVEVSAVMPCGDNGVTTCNHKPEAADRFAVYIRNPLAFHVDDFFTGAIGAKAPGGHDVWGTAEQAKAAAFNYADGLAEHLGCEVVSALQR